jgi:hypothetical protein
MSTEPQVYIDYNNRTADSLEVAYSKYNSHYHSETTKLNFYSYNIVPGDTLTMYTDNNESVFTGTCTVSSFTDVGLILSKSANFTIEKGKITVNNKTYLFINTTIGSNLITIEPENGVVTPFMGQYTNIEIIRGSLNYKLTGKTFLSLGKEYKLRLTKLKYYARSTTITAPSELNLIKSSSEGGIVSYFPSQPISSDLLVIINLPLDNSKYILNSTDYLYIDISLGTNYQGSIAASVPLLDYELEGYIIS